MSVSKVGLFVAMAAVVALCSAWFPFILAPKASVIHGNGGCRQCESIGQKSARAPCCFMAGRRKRQSGRTAVWLRQPRGGGKHQQAKAVVDAASAQADKADAGKAQRANLAPPKPTISAPKLARDMARATATRLDGLFNDGVVSRQQRDEA